ncbi:tyrosine-type recombinase/integrase [Bacillus thuringiensis]|uniref:tyrosine-type recombinase/integrase n=1 Tax=Bacillus thuringiensis TaxID=1428 RepID=UPI00333643F7
MPHSSLIDEYSLYMRRSGRKQSTITTYHYEISLFLKWLQKHQDVTAESLKVLTSNDIQIYLDSLTSKSKYAAASLKQKYTCIKSFLEYYKAQIDINKEPPSKLKESNFPTDQDIKRLLSTMQSFEGLSEYQANGRQYIIKRNILLVHLILSYGLSINDIVTLSMNDINFGTGIIKPGKETAIPRQVKLCKEVQKLLFTYYKEIPEVLRPRQHTSDSLFVAFDFARLTFRWNYKTNSPQPLSKRSIQDMLKKESKRANINVTPSILRNRFILNSLRDSVQPQEIKSMLGLKSTKTLYPYIDFYNELKSKNKI